MWSGLLSLFLVCVGVAASPRYDTQAVPENWFGPKSGSVRTWGVLVAGTKGYMNYRHQADICHAYQVLRNNGIPEENIIVMMYDDIANNERNPTSGQIINQPDGPNVYHGVPKHYTGKDVTAENFLNILSGNKGALKGVGSGRVIESDSNDVIFVNIVTNAGPGVLYFPEGQLMADQLHKTISEMSAKSKFSKMVLYVEACHGGGVFDTLFSDLKNVFVLTGSDPFEASHATYYDEERDAFLGDVFSVTWMNDTEHGSYSEESLHQQFERVRQDARMSHVEEYGDLDVGKSKVKDILGVRGRSDGYTPVRLPRYSSTTSNLDVPLYLLEKRILSESWKLSDIIKKQQLKFELAQFFEKRMFANKLFDTMIETASKMDAGKSSYQPRINELRSSKYGLNWTNYPCYKQLYQKFNEACLNTVESPFTRLYFQRMVNMCTVPWMTAQTSLQAVSDTCQKMMTPTAQRLLPIY